MGCGARCSFCDFEHYFLVNDREPTTMSLKGMVSIWFFVGCLLTVYGLLILIEGVRDYSNQSAGFLLPELHLQLWWGIGLLILGCVYLVQFRPGKTK